MRKVWRLIVIFYILFRYGLDELAVSYFPSGRIVVFYRCLFFWRNLSVLPGARLRKALEELGPIFIKFGQMLSTRRDLLPADIADELSKLQDRVPPFDSNLAVEQITKYLGAPPEELFASFDRIPVASASVAQVHFARLHNGREVAVKVLRPEMQKRIGRDIELMYVFAALGERFWRDGKRLRLTAVVHEFDKSLHDELDLMREAANYSQLRRNFADSDKLMVPEIFWDYCSTNVIVMEKMVGIPISRTDRLLEAGLDLKKLASNGVEIFLTQVFRDAFFHADMHPGNILISVEPATFGRYIALDLGIVGMLDDFDKEYLSKNFVAFFRRDYRMVAEANIESGWAPPDTSVVELEAAVRTCCEPMFDRPLRDFSFGMVLMRLFQTSRRFNIEIQPQLVLLQKTMLNIEGLGRQLDPDLDLWKTAKPFLEEWMDRQIGFRGLLDRFKAESVNYSRIIPQLPRLVQGALENVARPDKKSELLDRLVVEQARINRRLNRLVYFGGGVLIGILLVRILLNWRYFF
ncbi:ubiquinone biosynthesis regulatory protein kinase UbiB [Oxalobacter paraformigenes]|uniref:2-polyprenylphenol 6-hydroxylase n=1 Tax=Oxalobacter paraformigenes TaxID=556268 RepID=C3X6C5_9BURK|nr:ubiquinone biosynthesis regulatory protein kinase UbiB [Oxalobacter paraformigenes]EEO28761.1 2-polyprenylphenol 6-hydroxylase [Oxalobacter paraformigenes]